MSEIDAHKFPTRLFVGFFTFSALASTLLWSHCPSHTPFPLGPTLFLPSLHNVYFFLPLGRFLAAYF